MKKDAYYFPHYSNARNDRKVMKLRRVLGLEGYAIFFMLLEVLREQTDFKFPLDGISELEYEFRVSKEKIISVVNDYELFTIDKNMFFSINLVAFLQPYLEKSERARKAALKRWNNAKALQMHSKSTANAYTSKVNESRVNESKVNESRVNELKKEFEIIWNLYNHKVGKKLAYGKFKYLNKTEIEQIKKHIPLFIANHKEFDKMTFLPRLYGYFDNAYWEDENLPYKKGEKKNGINIEVLENFSYE